MRIAYYHLTEPSLSYKELHETLPLNIKGNQFLLDKKLGIGGCRFLKIQEGLWAQKLEFQLNDDLELQRVPTKQNDFYLVNFQFEDNGFYNTSLRQNTTDDFSNITEIITSSMTPLRITIPAHRKIRMFSLIFSKEWLFDNVLVDHHSLYNLFQTNRPVNLAIHLDFKIKTLLRTIDIESNYRLTSISIIIQILDCLFQKFKIRKLSDVSKSRIHPNDLAQLMKIRNQIDEKPEDMILLEDMAKSAGMSLSKFKRLFKTVFGTTPYRYYLINKMERAKEILEDGGYSVSETGLILGYSNLSKFSKAFKNQFGILPSEVEPMSV